MPNITAAKKALRSDARKRVFNDSRRRAMREQVKAFKKLLADKKPQEASKILGQVYQAIDKAAKKGVIKKNTASRKKSRIAHALARTSVS